MISPSPKSTPNPQRGIISIMMAMMLIIITGLIVLGFAQLSRRTQRETLDAQLSSQAYYAAESGINDAIKAIIKKIDTGKGVPAKTTCNGANPKYPHLTGSSANIDATNNVSYTCLLIQPEAPKLTAAIGRAPVVFSLKTSNGNLSSIKLHWQEPKNLPPGNSYGQCPNTVSGNDDFQQSGKWRCKYGVLRIDLAATDDLNQAALRNSANTMAAFVVPTRGGIGSTGFNSKNIVEGVCGNNGGCDATITGLSSHNDYSLRISGLYLDNFQLNVDGRTVSGMPAKFVGQATIDSTGKAQDVLRRIVEVVNLVGNSDGNNMPVALMSGDSVCKRFSTYQNGGGSHFWIASVSFPGGGNNPLCRGNADVAPAPPPPVQPPPPATPSCRGDIDVMFTLDYSSSMEETWETTSRIKKLVSVVDYFADNVGMSPDGIHAGAVTFNGGDNGGNPPPKLIPLSGDKNNIINTLNTDWDGGTQYLDGLNLTNQEFNGPRSRHAYEVMVFVSDGRPSDPPGQILQMTDEMKKQGIVIYTIGIVPNGDPGTLLQKMAGNGGRYVPADHEAQLEAIIQEISSKLHCQ